MASNKTRKSSKVNIGSKAVGAGLGKATEIAVSTGFTALTGLPAIGPVAAVIGGLMSSVSADVLQRHLKDIR
jgi:hypothetical protein